MRKILLLAAALLVLIVASGFFIPIQLSAPPDARTIVDHTNHTYVTPPCFNDAEVSNYLQETDYAHAQELEYEPESSCTEETLTEKNVPINIALLKTIGITETKWDDETIWG
ncbi:hypothetical protein ACE1TI_01625 [Alteribacillus sp. JSM 102045]|uniref:hypothetical protein n=1 Tax=Alteribacillus sp. JSM 102045 TaxID=1562101 RepID=UPI0035BFFD4C